ncbi:MAG: glycosyltransferase family 52 protein [Clostridium sp.]|nr:glycosyltransferase family 52 protein [Clostridium sp.]
MGSKSPKTVHLFHDEDQMNLAKRKRGDRSTPGAARIYVCHTYYHVYVSFLKELNLPKERRGEATLVLSLMSTDFEDLKARVKQSGIFLDVLEYDEKRDDFFPQLQKWRKNKQSLLKNLYQRIRFTRRFAKLQAAYIPVDFRRFDDIYVFCDSDPIGYYLNQYRIYYHALEDGLDSVKNCDTARFDNRGHFALKAKLSMKWNLIFIQNGYGKYCLDMEVNDIRSITHPCPRYIEQPIQALVDALHQTDKELMLRVFVRDFERLYEQLKTLTGEEKKILILTDPLCTLDIREQIFRDIIAMYETEGMIFLKPHPRDSLDYRNLFSQITQFDATMPMEMFHFFPGICFDKAVGVLTEMKGIKFAKETVRLGPDFMDRYEDPLIHRQNEQIY